MIRSLAAISILFAGTVYAADWPPASELPALPQLPDPLHFADGENVQTDADWARRRAEIADMIQAYEYGFAPPAPGNVRVVDGSRTVAIDEVSSRQSETLRLSMGPGDTVMTAVHVYLPAERGGPLPVIIRIGIDEDYAEPILSRGYAYVCFAHKELDPDTSGHDVVGPAQAAYPEYDWGSIAVWAWGAQRVLDYLETVPEIDATRSVITGHSRLGKTALLAGALDERFAIVVPNGSGCGGAGSFRFSDEKAESLKQITDPKRFKAWFHEDFGQFGDAVGKLPFDQHFMRALVAPRVVLSTDALGDRWANPPGTLRMWQAAQPVFDRLGADDRNLAHFREGGHDQNKEDIAVLLDVADWHFRGMPLDRDFSLRPSE